MDSHAESDLSSFLGEQGSVDRKEGGWTESGGLVEEGHGFCAICLEKILIQETALVKDCEHAYCVTCILRWAMYNKSPSCPQCKHPFEFLSVHRSLDGCIHDYLFEESVCLLLRATWFVPLSVEAQEDSYEEADDLLQFYHDEDYVNDDDDDDINEAYFSKSSSSIRIGNRRWGENGYVRAGRKEARPVNRRFSEDLEAGPSSRPPPKKKETLSSTPPTGRRAKRALKREAAAAKHQQTP
ncbi:hypothetical protein AXF42_Ash004503 [Apostasia shenzhenica]|uniref:RING-type domain-containing protein n=1 Tax=Apostasia shenzhenica TaxID=1088818 RepID=A0A2I0BGV6_9ASPA|nr:hypothetical protein AXF42_Ash004503 [Apostasia shenzhenica]